MGPDSSSPELTAAKAMMLSIQTHLGGILCLSFGLGIALLLILWKGVRRIECPTCHHANRAHARYCARCGRALFDWPRVP